MSEQEKTPPLILVRNSSNSEDKSTTDTTIADMLTLAKKQMQAGNLISPTGNNALETYRNIISIDTDNENAFDGIAELKQQLMDANLKEESKHENHDVAESTITTEERSPATLAEDSTETYGLINEERKDNDPKGIASSNPEPADPGHTIQPNHSNLNQNPKQNSKRLYVAVPIVFFGAIAAFLYYTNTSTQNQLSETSLVSSAVTDDNANAITSQANPETTPEKQTVAQQNQTDELQQELDNLLTLSKEYLQNSQFITPENNNALAVFNKILKQDPEHTEALLGMEILKQKLYTSALNAEKQKDWSVARSQIEALTRIEPKNQQFRSALIDLSNHQSTDEKIASLLTQGRTNFDAGRYTIPVNDNALSYYKQVLAIAPGNLEARAGIDRVEDEVYKTAIAARDKKEWTEAQAQLEQVLQIDPLNTAAQNALEEVIINKTHDKEISELLARGERYLTEDKLMEPLGENAQFVYLQVLQSDPGNVTAKQQLDTVKNKMIAQAETARKENDWENARNHLTAALKLDPSNTGIQSALLTLTDEQKIAEGNAVLSIQTQTQQEKIDALMVQGEERLEDDLYTSPDGSGALSSFQKVLRIEPENQRAHAGIAQIESSILGLAISAKDSNQWDEAQQLLQQVLTINPSNTSALQALKEAVVNKSKQSDLSELLSQAQQHIANGRFTEPSGNNAAFVYLQILQHAPENKTAKNGIDEIASQLLAQAETALLDKNWDIARIHLESAQKIQPQNTEVQQALATLSDKQSLSAHVNVLLEQARETLTSKETNQNVSIFALEAYKKVLRLDDNNNEARVGIEKIKTDLLDAATLAIENEQWESVSENLSMVLAIDDTNNQARELQGQLSNRQNKAQEINGLLEESNQLLAAEVLTYDQAMSTYTIITSVLERHPDNPYALLNRKVLVEKIGVAAHSAYLSKNWNDAEKYYELILQINPADKRVSEDLKGLTKERNYNLRIGDLLARGDRYMQSGQLIEPAGDNAFTVYKQILSLDPSNSKAKNSLNTIESDLFNLASTAIDNEEIDAARTHYQSILTINPHSRRAHDGLQTLADRTGSTTGIETKTANVAVEHQISEQELLDILTDN